MSFAATQTAMSAGARSVATYKVAAASGNVSVAMPPARLSASRAAFASGKPLGAAIAQRASAAVARAGRMQVVNAVATEKISVSDCFNALKAKGQTALIPFLVAGDPDLETTIKALELLDEEGADIIEVGVPYSDPLADGPTIQASATRALEKNVTLEDVLTMLGKVDIKAPIVIFTYFNPIMARGLEKFCKDAYAAGVRGLLVPDIPLEETGPIREVCEAAGLELVLLSTPTTPAPRAAKIAAATQGFMYLVSLTGVTGEKVQMESRVEGLIKVMKESTDKPVAVGFGISGPEQAVQVKKWGADGVIVGSAFVRSLGEAASPAEGLDELRKICRSIKEAIV